MSDLGKLQTIKRGGRAMGVVLAAVFAGSLLLSGQARADWDDGGYRHDRHHEEYREHHDYREYRDHDRPRYVEYRDEGRVYYGYPRQYYAPSGVTVYIPWLR